MCFVPSFIFIGRRKKLEKGAIFHFSICLGDISILAGSWIGTPSKISVYIQPKGLPSCVILYRENNRTSSDRDLIYLGKIKNSARTEGKMAQAVEEWYKQMPIITRSYLTAAIITTIGCSLEVYIQSVLILFYLWIGLVLVIWNLFCVIDDD